MNRLEIAGVADAIVDVCLNPSLNRSDELRSYFQTPYGVAIEVCRYVEDNDRGDEDDRERPAWTVVAKLLRPLLVHSAIHKIAVHAEVSL